MTIQEAKETVILAGKKLVESGLIARTWGNVSCRISDTHFVITPSGRDYLTLVPEEIVEVGISDCSYTGNVKPSSEKGIHAEVYKLHPEIHFVIHTHQEYASSVSAFMLDSIKVPLTFPSLHGEILCADYGLPGTKKLCRNVAKALTHSKGKGVIMKNHGALCFGVDYTETFKVAQELEEACKSFIINQYLMQGKELNVDPVEMACSILSKFTGKIILKSNDVSYLPCESERTEKGFKLKINGEVFDILLNKPQSNSFHDPLIDIEATVHNAIYNNHNSIHSIIHVNTAAITAVSYADMKVMPLLDDFAQIAGTSMKTTESTPDKISAALKNSSAVFVHNQGALCCGSSKGEAQAVSIVVEKNCKALIGAALLGRVKYINPLESLLMRLVYQKKYSRQAHIE